MTRSILLPCLAATVLACGSGRSAGPPPSREPVEVTTAIAAMQPMTQTFERGGVIRSQTIATLSSRIVAPVLATHAVPGDRVRRGQPLVTLDSRDLDAAARRADAAVTVAEQAVRTAEADRAAASASLTLATAAHGRVLMLSERRSATPQELDTAVADLRGAEARAGAADARIAEATAALVAAREDASAAHVSSSYAVITAPFDGIVTEKLVDAGNLASPGVPLMRVEDTRRFRLEVQVDESAASTIVAGGGADVIFDASATSVHGRIVEVSRNVDAGSHSFVVKIELPQKQALRSGMFARARFTSGPRTALAIPRRALVPQGQLSTVYVVSAHRARMRVVSSGDGSDTVAEILAGLAAGERVVVSPPLSLRDGDPVREADGSRR